MKKALIIIPARYASTRFPGKPLASLGGLPLIQHVVNVAEHTGIRTLVATDDPRIERCVNDFGGEVIMTNPEHKSGTDRIIEAYEKAGQGEEFVINLQGDEPFATSEQIELLLSAFDDPAISIATLAERFPASTSDAELQNPNNVKLVRSPNGIVHYFSRSVIPHLRGIKEGFCSKHSYYKHIGVYAFRASILGILKGLAPSPLELAESLEQLRWLEAGYAIRALETECGSIGIDTPEDLAQAEAFLQSQKGH